MTNTPNPADAVEGKRLSDDDVKLMQALFDRYSEDGGYVDLATDSHAFLKIIHKHFDRLASSTPEPVAAPDAVERAARAIYERMYDIEWPGVNSAEGELFRESAKAALAAISPSLDTEIAQPKGPHPSHVTRFSDSSQYDEVCTICGATDVSGGGWGRLALPCGSLNPQSVVDSDRALGVYASCEWDELGDDGKAWIAAIIDEAVARVNALTLPTADTGPVAWITEESLSLLRENKAVKYSDIVPTKQRDWTVPLYAAPTPSLPQSPQSARGMNGEPQVPDAEAIEIWRIVEILTDGEGDTVNVLCPNPDFNGQPNYAIECNGYWTNWQDRRFAADRQVDCFRLALAELQKGKSHD